MKFVGAWSSGEFAKGKWVFPNGTSFDGEFSKNQPKGKGRWAFKKGNTVNGEYSHAATEEENAEGDKKMKIKVNWKTDSEIVKAAENVNSNEEFL